MKLAGLLVLLFMFLSVLPAQSQQPIADDKLVVPGGRIGKWTLAMTVADLMRLEGAPDIELIQTYPIYARPIVWMAWVRIRLDVYTHDRSKIATLCTDGRDFGTEKQIMVYGNLDRAGIVAAYGTPTASLGQTPNEGSFIFDEIGLEITVRDGFVWSLCVFPPKTARTIWKF